MIYVKSNYKYGGNKGNFEYCNTNSHIFGSGNDLV